MRYTKSLLILFFIMIMCLISFNSVSALNNCETSINSVNSDEKVANSMVDPEDNRIDYRKTRIVDLTNNTVFFIFPEPDDNNIVLHATLKGQISDGRWLIEILRGINFYLIDSDHNKVWQGKAYTKPFTGIASIKVKSKNLHPGEFRLTAYYPGSDELLEPLYPCESSSTIILEKMSPIGSESNQTEYVDHIQPVTGKTISLQNTGTPINGVILALLMIISSLFIGNSPKKN